MVEARIINAVEKLRSLGNVISEATKAELIEVLMDALQTIGASDEPRRK